MSEKLKEIIENMPKDILINSFETVYEDSIKKDLEIERLNSIIKEVREYVENVETLATIDKVNIFSISTLKSILDKESDKE